MKAKTAISGSLSNKGALTDAEINAGFSFNTILESPDLNGQLFDIDNQVDIISKEICNFLTSHSVTPVGSDSTQLGTLIDTMVGGKQDKLTAGQNITIDGNNVISTTGASALNFPLFATMWLYSKPFNSSWVNANNYSWLYASMYVSAYNFLVSQLHPTGTAEQGSTYYVLRFDNGEGETTNVLVNSGTLADLQTYCTAQGYTYNAAGTIEEFECYKTLSTSSETIEGVTITYYETYNGMKIITDAAEITNEETIYNLIGVDNYFILDEVNNRFKLPRINPARKDLITLMRAKGNGTTIGFTDGTNNGGLITGKYMNGVNSAGGTVVQQLAYNTQVGISTGLGNFGFYDGSNASNNILFNEVKTLGLTTDSTKSGIVIDPTDSDTVKDGSFTYLYFYLGNTGDVVDHQIASIALELFNGKVDLDAQNLNATGKSTVGKMALPSDTYEDLTLGASATTYTMSHNGYLLADLYFNNANGMVYVFNTNTYLGMQSTRGNGGRAIAYVPVKKGDVIQVDYDLTMTGVNNFRLVYSVGEV